MKLQAVVMLLGLGGCAALQPGAGVVDAIVAEAVIAARAPGAEQNAALARAERAFASGAPADRLRLATLLATLPAPLRDDARAAELLEPIADASAPTATASAPTRSATSGKRRCASSSRHCGRSSAASSSARKRCAAGRSEFKAV